MRRPCLVVALLAALALTGCGALRAVVGPDPALVAAQPTIEAALGRDSAANPEQKPANDAASDALDGAVNPTFPPIPPIPLPFPWTPLLSIVGTLGAAFTAAKTARRVAQKRTATIAPAGKPPVA